RSPILVRGCRAELTRAVAVRVRIGLGFTRDWIARCVEGRSSPNVPNEGAAHAGLPNLVEKVTHALRPAGRWRFMDSCRQGRRSGAVYNGLDAGIPVGQEPVVSIGD